MEKITFTCIDCGERLDGTTGVLKHQCDPLKKQAYQAKLREEHRTKQEAWRKDMEKK